MPPIVWCLRPQPNCSHREPANYGHETLAATLPCAVVPVRSFGLTVEFRQTNHEANCSTGFTPPVAVAPGS